MTSLISGKLVYGYNPDYSLGCYWSEVVKNGIAAMAS